MQSQVKKVLISGIVSNALEWYDFILFVQFAPFIGSLFFPSADDKASLLAAFSVFAVGFIMRPLGGILFGYIGDKFGRKTSLVVSILMMAVPTALIGFLPTYDLIGIWAPIALTIIRLMQGLALGGGFSGCMTFLVEHANINQRGIIGSTSMFSLGLGVLLGIVITTICSCCMDINSFKSWGWRLPFITSLLVGMVAFYIRNHVHESPIFEKAKKEGKISKTPVRQAIKSYPKELLVAVGIYLTVTVPFYTLTAFFNTFLQTKIGFSLENAMIINGVSISIFMVFVIISGYLSDRIGRRTVLVISAIAIAIIAYPVFKLINTGTFMKVLYGEIIFAIFLGLYMGPVPATLVELFPTRVRFSGLSLSYNVSAAMFGGTVPYIYIKLIDYTGSNLIPAFYIILFTVLTVYSLYNYQERYKLALAE